MLIDLYMEEREQERCVIIHDLKRNQDMVKEPFNSEIDIIEKRRSELDKEKSDLYNEIHKLGVARDAKLKEYKLFYFGARACGDALHDDLMDFDRATKVHIREILEE